VTSGAFDEYLAGVAPEHRKALERLADQIRKAAPGTEEVISYKIPTFKYRGKPLLYLAAHEKHCSVYPYTDRMMAECGDELAGRTSGKGTIRFTARDPLPARLVTKLVKIRITEIDEGNG
jgi:uncharacterized protein YdhG (YjbR/CyaY superfamily)